MSNKFAVPATLKYRRESDFGLLYDHEGYGYEDATLVQVDEVVIDVLEFVEDEAPGRETLDRQFSAPTVETLLDAGYLTDA